MNTIHQLIAAPWPWYVGGPLIGVFVVFLLVVEKKQLGISSSLQYTCAKLFPIDLEYLKGTEKVRWQFLFVIGLVIGGIVCSFLPAYEIAVAPAVKLQLQLLGVHFSKGYFPKELFNYSISGLFWLFLGGVLIGFGARYANGCTAGHAIMGVSQLSVASIVTTACFFAGGLLATHFILPFIF